MKSFSLENDLNPTHTLSNIKSDVMYFQENVSRHFFPSVLIEAPFSQKYATLTVRCHSQIQNSFLTLFFPMFPFDPHEKFFWCFQGDQRGTLGRNGLSVKAIPGAGGGLLWRLRFTSKNNTFCYLKVLKTWYSTSCLILSFYSYISTITDVFWYIFFFNFFLYLIVSFFSYWLLASFKFCTYYSCRLMHTKIIP